MQTFLRAHTRFEGVFWDYCCAPQPGWVPGEEYERIRAGFAKCGIELWELYGHGPAASGESFMWTEAHRAWEADNPPPLEPIGEQSWRLHGCRTAPHCCRAVSAVFTTAA